MVKYKQLIEMELQEHIHNIHYLHKHTLMKLLDLVVILFLLILQILQFNKKQIQIILQMKLHNSIKLM